MRDNAADMRHVEKPPLPQVPKQEEGVEAARLQMRKTLHQWQLRNFHLYAATAATVAGLSVFHSSGRHEAVGNAAELWSPKLKGLDPEITPERFVAIMGTYPRGFVDGSVCRMGYKDEIFSMGVDKGMVGSVKVASAEDVGGGVGAPTLLTFYRGVKSESSKELWGQTVPHEIAHANDDDSDHTMSVREREAFRISLRTRLVAADRHPSFYVDTIISERKVTEYWAVIFAAYLDGDPMAPDDEEIVKAVIRRKDPAFDRDAALARRNAILAEMTGEKNRRSTAPKPSGPARKGLADWTIAFSL